MKKKQKKSLTNMKNQEDTTFETFSTRKIVIFEVSGRDTIDSGTSRFYRFLSEKKTIITSVGLTVSMALWSNADSSLRELMLEEAIRLLEYKFIDYIFKNI